MIKPTVNLDIFPSKIGGLWHVSKPLSESNLVGGLEHCSFFHIGNFINPTDELILFRGVGIPPTSIYI